LDAPLAPLSFDHEEQCEAFVVLITCQ